MSQSLIFARFLADTFQSMVSFQPTMQANDELAALFFRNLTFNPGPQQQPAWKPADNEPKQLPHESGITSPDHSSNPITYSISQHYTHSAHLTQQIAQPQDQQPGGQEPQRRSSEPPQSETVEMILLHHGISHTQLSPSQLQLFRISDNSARERLIDIWSAAPPSTTQDNPSLAWSTTTLEQEEFWARQRYEQRQQTEAPVQDTSMSLDGTQVQAQDSRWLSAYQSAGAEPYMMSGYEELMRRENQRQAEEQSKTSFSPYGSAVGAQRYSQATDPVYKNTGAGWNTEQQQAEMENQSGSFQQHRFGGPVGTAATWAAS